MRWPGFRKVRRQVGRRIDRRRAELGLPDLAAYRRLLEDDPTEWLRLRELCRVTISRFHRDRRLFEVLRESVLPELARRAAEREPAVLRAWSAGCASGEEPYTLAIIWGLALRARFPQVSLEILATDVDPHVLQRAAEATYPASSVRELPDSWRERAFIGGEGAWHLRAELRDGVGFQCMDLLEDMPPGPFDLILCRYLAFTYFDEDRQRAVAQRFAARLSPHGRLVIGSHEKVPPGCGLLPAPEHPHLYRKP
jgi:chemotaxis protein methyltransferase CheR